MPSLDDTIAIAATDDWSRQHGQAVQAIQSNPQASLQSASAIGAWANIAPTLPAGMLQSLGNAGIDPNSDMGKWLVRDAVMRITAPDRFNDPGKAEQATRVLNNPQLLYAVQQMPLDQQQHLFSSRGAESLAGLSDSQLNRVLQGHSANEGFWDHVGNVAGGIFNLAEGRGYNNELAGQNFGSAPHLAGSLGDVQDDAHTAVRWASAAGMAGYEAIQAGSRATMASLPRGLLATGGDPIKALAPAGGTTQQLPLGSSISYGTPAETSNLVGQTTLGQMVLGRNAGEGLIPGGEAHDHAVLAQKAAASVNGHALTPGRALAAYVTPPGTIPYNIVSGAVDATIAMKGDPAALAMGELSDAHNATRILTATSEDARIAAAHSLFDQAANDPGAMVRLRTWAGADHGVDIIDAVQQKFKDDPFLPDFADKTRTLRDMGAPVAGAFKGLRKYIHQQSFMEWANSPAGDAVWDESAKAGFVRLRQIWGKDVPVEAIAQMHHMDDPNAIRQLMTDTTAGNGALADKVRAVPEAGYEWKSNPYARWSSLMPHGTMNFQDKNGAVEQVERMLGSTKVAPSQWDGLLAKVAGAETKGEFGDAIFHDVSNAMADTLAEEHGLPKQAARAAVRFYHYNTPEDARFWTDELGNMPSAAGFTADGQAYPISGPVLGAELTGDIPVLNGRHLRRTASKLGEFLAVTDPNLMEKTPGTIGPRTLRKTILAADWAANGGTQAWKAGKLMRLALPIRIVAEGMLRMSVGGLAAFSSPFDYAAMTIGSNLKTDINAENFLEHIGEGQSTMLAGVGKSSYLNETSVFDPTAQAAKHFTQITSADPEFNNAWANELSILHTDAVPRNWAAATLDPANYTAGLDDSDLRGMDALKQSFWDGPLQNFRHDLIDGNVTWNKNEGIRSSALVDRTAADAYIDNVVGPRVMQKTGNHPDLLDVVAEGRPFKANGSVDELMGQLKQYQDYAPEYVKALKKAGPGRARVAGAMLDRFFSSIVDAPYRVMVKSPTWRQYYWKEGERLLPHLTAEAQDHMILSAKVAGLNFTKPAEAGTLAAADAEKLMHVRALQDSQDILHYVSERNNMADTLRYIAPFGDAWRNVVTQWVKLVAEHPQTLRRLEQGVIEARQSGFFHTVSDQTGKGTEVFTFMPGAGTKALTGVDFPMVAPVSGVNIAASGLPGVGPAVQVLADQFMPKGNPVSDSFRHWLMPYGGPDLTGGVVESLFPGWLDRFRSGGYLGPIGADAQQKVTVQDLAKYVFEQKASTRKYNLADPDVLQKLADDSLRDAKVLYGLRGLAQMISPSAPNFVPQVYASDPNQPLKDGQTIETWRLTKDYHDMIAAAGGDTYKATLQFVGKYGADKIFSTQGLNKPNVFGVPTTAEGVIFQGRHPDLFSKYKTTIGYWVPQGGPFDYQAYLDGIASGKIQALSVADWAKLANARLGNAAYSNFRSQVGTNPNSAQQAWLAQKKTALQTEFPGYDEDATKTSRDTLPQTIRELRRAVVDKQLRNEPLSHAISVYLALRDKALQSVADGTGRPFDQVNLEQTPFQANRWAATRGWLFQKGTAIATQMPEFTTIWNDLFSHEVDQTSNP